MAILTRASRIIRGIRSPLRQNTIVGRLSPGDGPAEMLSISDILGLGIALDDLSDATIASPTNGQVLKYNSTSGLWENAADDTGAASAAPENFYSDRMKSLTATKSPSAYATKGFQFTPEVAMDVHRVSGWFAPVASADYTACVVPIGGIGIDTLNGDPVFSDTLTNSLVTTVRWNQFVFSTPASLSAGTRYAVLISRVDGGDTYVLPIGFSVDNADPDAALDMPGIPDTEYILLDKAVPADEDVTTRANGNMPMMGMCIETT